MKHLQKIGLFLAMVLVFSAMIMQLSYAEEPLYTYDELMDALYEAAEKNGPTYTWSFQEKADFYNKYIYFNKGSRRGVPDETCLDTDTVIEIAKKHVAEYLTENKIDADLEQCLIDVDFWIECFMDQEREHEYYSVLFFKEREKPTEDRKIYSSQYQVALSPYSGEVWYFTDLKKEKEENHLYDE